MYKQLRTCVKFRCLPENLACTSQRSSIHQKHYEESNNQSRHKYNAVDVKSNSHKQTDRRRPWAETMHRQLMKSVVLPPKIQG